MKVHEVVKKLIGPIEPIGETNTDAERLMNLNETIDLVDLLLFDISSVAIHSYRDEHSMSKSGKVAQRFLEETRASL